MVQGGGLAQRMKGEEEVEEEARHGRRMCGAVSPAGGRPVHG